MKEQMVAIRKKCGKKNIPSWRKKWKKIKFVQHFTAIYFNDIIVLKREIINDYSD